MTKLEEAAYALATEFYRNSVKSWTKELGDISDEIEVTQEDIDNCRLPDEDEDEEGGQSDEELQREYDYNNYNT